MDIALLLDKLADRPMVICCTSFGITALLILSNAVTIV
jgi:hypothetical protein